jgi:hypothetical protein
MPLGPRPRTVRLAPVARYAGVTVRFDTAEPHRGGCAPSRRSFIRELRPQTPSQQPRLRPVQHRRSTPWGLLTVAAVSSCGFAPAPDHRPELGTPPANPPALVGRPNLQPPALVAAPKPPLVGCPKPALVGRPKSQPPRRGWSVPQSAAGCAVSPVSRGIRVWPHPNPSGVSGACPRRKNRRDGEHPHAAARRSRTNPRPPEAPGAPPPKSPHPKAGGGKSCKRA